MSAENIYSLVQQYLTARVGKACIFGDGEIKNLRLSAAARMTIREDYKRIAGQTSALKRHWDSYLKGTKPNLSITFSADAAKLSAEKNENVTLISAVHPLVRQAAEFLHPENALISPCGISRTNYLPAPTRLLFMHGNMLAFLPK